MKTTTLGIDQIKHRTQTTLYVIGRYFATGWALASIKRTDWQLKRAQQARRPGTANGCGQRTTEA
jgi:hypothetical protein